VNLTNALIQWLAARLRVPSDALEFFRIAQATSGLDEKTLPSELIPLNTRQIARGVLNFAVLQSLTGWVFPYWATRQYDPRDPAFIPRSHLGLSINITHRNWTAIGNPDSPVEPTVDPAGLLTPLRGGWSIDVWMRVDGSVVFPSRERSLQQGLLHDLPIVETRVDRSGVRLTTTAWTEGQGLFLRAKVQNRSRGQRHFQVAFAIRPFNAEGIGLLHHLEFNAEAEAFILEGKKRVSFSRKPGVVRCRTHQEGDSAADFAADNPNEGGSCADCPTGLANGYAAFSCDLEPAGSEEIEASCDMKEEGRTSAGPHSPLRAEETWEKLLAGGAKLMTPEPELNALERASHATLLQLSDGRSITPGPATYHQFWFRDAAYMLLALNRFGQFHITRPVIESFPSRQERSGYFRSQQGEWDSNGEALWTVWQYSLLSGDRALPESLFESLTDGVRWIDETRQAQKEGEPGLLPSGLSAEHLGLSDHYFWDNFWSLAGVEAFARLCQGIGREDEARRAEKLSRRYRQDIEKAISSVQATFKIREIPATPTRGIDHGMIGSCSASYPLQIFSGDDPRIKATLRTLQERYFQDGLFFHQFIHSGMNPYLTLHVAHAWLLAGNRRKFLEILKNVIAHASPTKNFPEAIHPLTGGGSMGDGHHGWAAAEILLALRDMCVFESWNEGTRRPDLTFLAGIPRAWCEDRGELSLRKLPVPGGRLDLDLSSRGRHLLLQIAFERTGYPPQGRWVVRLPLSVESARVEKTWMETKRVGSETLIEIPSNLPLVRLRATLSRR
jgi:hypothetical protein